MIYLLHFLAPLHHAQHYMGFADGGMEAVARRIARHKRGSGSKLMRAIKMNGIRFELAATWPGDRKEERRMKRCRKSRKDWCPICNQSKREVHGGK